MAMLIATSGCASDSTAAYDEADVASDPDDPNWDVTGDELRVGESCSPSRAVGVVSKYESGFLEILAYAEGTRDKGRADGYNVMFGHRNVSSCVSHPNRVYCDGICSTAAGRYQFLYKTWKSLKLPTFKPENQARGAITLIKRRKVTLRNDSALSATEFKSALDKLSYEWASLPPGRYGQPNKSVSQLWTVYASELNL